MATMIKGSETAEKKTPRARPWEFSWEHRNVGGPERGSRLLLGAGAAVGATIAAGVWVKAVLSLAAIAGLLTGVGGYCPVNRAIGRNSRR